MTNTKMTRRGLMGAGAGMGAAALIGKGAMAGPAPSWKFVPTSNQEEITLDVFVHANHPFDRVKPLYEAKYPNVTLNMMEQNDVAILRAALAAGEGVPDIFWPEIEMVQELGKTGILLDVTDIVEANAENLSPGKTAECFIPSTSLYAAFPGDIATVGLYYRQDKLDEAGRDPSGSVDLGRVCSKIGKQIKEATGAASLVIPTGGTAIVCVSLSFILCQLGGAITNADGTEITFDNDLGIAAMEQTARLYQADIAIDEEPFEENYFAEIAAGNVAITPQAVWYRGFGIDPNATDETGGLGQWRTALLPSAGEGSLLTANLGGAAIASTTYTEHPEEVKNFMVHGDGHHGGRGSRRRLGHSTAVPAVSQSDEWTSVRDEAFGEFAFNECRTKAVAQYPATWYKQPVYLEAMTTWAPESFRCSMDPPPIPEGLKALGDQAREINSRYQ